MTKVVYTVLFGNYTLHEPTYKNKDWTLICYSDRERESDNWEIVHRKVKDPLKESRLLKIRSDLFLDYDICLYLDAKFTVTCDLNKFVKANMRSDLLVMKHNKRVCAYDEASFCTKIKKDKRSVIQHQIAQYEREGFPKHFGLFAPGIMFKRNTDEVNKFMELWYQEIKQHSYRDIISFPYVLWKYPIDVLTMPFKETYRRFKP